VGAMDRRDEDSLTISHFLSGKKNDNDEWMNDAL